MRLSQVLKFYSTAAYCRPRPIYFANYINRGKPRRVLTDEGKNYFEEQNVTPNDARQRLERFERLEKTQLDSTQSSSSKNSNKSKSHGGKTRVLAAAGLLSLSLFPLNKDDRPRDERSSDMKLFEELHGAVLEGNEGEVKRLIKQCSPAEINARHELGWQVLHLAAANGRAKICELLIQNGAKINDVDLYSSPTLKGRELEMDPLLVSLTRDDQFKDDLPRGLNFAGSSALHYAILANSFETVKVLANYGVNPNLKTEQGFEALRFSTDNKISKFIQQYQKDYLHRQKQLEAEERRRYPLEKRVKEHLVGQDAAISMVAATIRRKENGWFDEDHPLVFLFLGSSGVGKTELAKQIANYLHKDNRDAFVRLDMSEYQEQHSVARMIGAPPGYIGHQDGGQLTEALKKCSNAVVLFDEIEKAHPKVLTVLLQLFDEGRLTDGMGRTIECKDAIFIMTSNLASDAIAEHAVKLRGEQQLVKEVRLQDKMLGITEESRELIENDYKEQVTISRAFKDNVVKPVLKAALRRNEFLGRINEMVYFLPFSESELRQLVVKELEYWASRSKKNNSIELTWDERVVDLICKEYDVHYGARSIKHAVGRRIINEISELHWRHEKAKHIHVTVNDSAGGKPELIRIKIS